MATTWTDADLTALDAAIATGAFKVRYADGREVTYRSLADLRSIRDEVKAALDAAFAASMKPRRTVAGYCSGL